MFLSSREEPLKSILENVKNHLWLIFIKIKELKYNVFIDEMDKPIGGKWSFDEENRKKLPKKIDLPESFHIRRN